MAVTCDKCSWITYRRSDADAEPIVCGNPDCGAPFATPTCADRVSALAAAMRAVGAGRATLDGLSLDLTEAALPAPAAIRTTAKTMTDEEIRTRDERILYGAGAGQKVKLR